MAKITVPSSRWPKGHELALADVAAEDDLVVAVGLAVA